MSKFYLDLSFFRECEGGDALSVDSKIAEAIAMLENEDDILVININFMCNNEAELRALLTERGIL